MLNSPLQLKGYFLKELEFALSEQLKNLPSKESDYDDLGMRLEVETSRSTENPREWRCQIAVASQDDAKKNHPYRFRVVYVGFFEISNDYPIEKVELLAKTNAPALLYSAARETLVSLTSRGPVPPLMLPSITFIEAPKTLGVSKTTAKKKARSK